MLDDPAIEVVDVAVPPDVQPGVIRRVLGHPRRVRGILAQKPLAMSYREAANLVDACERAGVVLQVNQNMRYDPSVRALKSLVDEGRLGDPVLATIELRAIPHWMPWAESGRSLSTFIMSIHHLDTFRYWLGDPARVLASTRPDPRTPFAHEDGINLYVLEYENGVRASGWDDVWSGAARDGEDAQHAPFAGVSRGPKVWHRRNRLAEAGPGARRASRLPDDPGRRPVASSPDGRMPGSPTPNRDHGRACSALPVGRSRPTSRTATTSRPARAMPGGACWPRGASIA